MPSVRTREVRDQAEKLFTKKTKDKKRAPEQKDNRAESLLESNGQQQYKPLGKIAWTISVRSLLQSLLRKSLRLLPSVLSSKKDAPKAEQKKEQKPQQASQHKQQMKQENHQKSQQSNAQMNKQNAPQGKKGIIMLRMKLHSILLAQQTTACLLSRVRRSLLLMSLRCWAR